MLPRKYATAKSQKQPNREPATINWGKVYSRVDAAASSRAEAFPLFPLGSITEPVLH
jgi:hypothetical protein